jgi:hypothetical protein
MEENLPKMEVQMKNRKPGARKSRKASRRQGLGWGKWGSSGTKDTCS